VHAFLQGLVTNDVSGNLPVYAALLSAQGKCMFDFLVWDGGDGSLLVECEADVVDDLVKRLSLYRLRRQIEIAREDTLASYWNSKAFEGSIADPRLPELGFRTVLPVAETASGDASYLRHRIALGVPEGRAEMCDILWLETNAAELNGVSFTKGCYIGQENTARMNWRQKVNRRLVVVPLDQSDPKRQKTAYPELDLAVDHLRVEDLDPASLPTWQRAGVED
jgi:folate-binding protein YgfZ